MSDQPISYVLTEEAREQLENIYREGAKDHERPKGQTRCGETV